MKKRPLMFVVGFCMAFSGAGAAEEDAFLGMAERYETIGNPYAPYMLRCGEVVQK